MKKLIITFAAMLILCGCAKRGESVTPTNSKDDFNVQFLFEVNGVKVYRFYDGGRAVYFTNANGKCEYSFYNAGTKTYIDVETLCNSSND